VYDALDMLTREHTQGPQEPRFTRGPGNTPESISPEDQHNPEIRRASKGLLGKGATKLLQAM